jgi:putative peptidoglycan lipid II flippase
VTDDEPIAPIADGVEPARGTALAGVGRSAVILTGATAAVQLLGIVRELFLAAEVGISTSFDAVLVGLVLPATLSSVLTAGVSTALVPAYVDARSSHGLAGATRLAGTVLAWVALAGLLVAVLLELFAPAFIRIAGPGLSPADQAQAVGYLRLVAPTTLLASISGILFAVCQAEGRFSSLGWAIVAGPTTSLIILLALWDRLGLTAYALGTVLGPIVSVAILFVATVRRRARPRLHLRSPGLGLDAFARHAVPLTISSAILQVNVIFDRALASLIAPGAVSALRYGDTLVRVPTGAIAPAWGAAIYPALVHSTKQPEGSGLADSADRSLRYVFAAFVPIAALTLAVAPVAASAAYGRGAFTAADLHVTALVVAGFAPLVCTVMVSQTLTGALNARRSGTVLLAAGILNVILNLTLDVVLGLSIGVAGIALSSSVTAIIVSAFKARQLARREAAFRLRPLGRYLALAVLASLPGALLCGALAWTGVYPSGLIPGLLTLALYGAIGGATYLALASRLGLDEPKVLVGIVVDRIARRRSAAGSV